MEGCVCGCDEGSLYFRLANLPQYDSQYALRLCLEKGLQEPCVHIYSSMGLYEECYWIHHT